jgi:hypothetical protein
MSFVAIMAAPHWLERSAVNARLRYRPNGGEMILHEHRRTQVNQLGDTETIQPLLHIVEA